jgi:hypothetical protein
VKDVVSEESTKPKCYEPVKNNPFMNYTIGDLMDNPDRLQACDYDDVKDKIRQEFTITFIFLIQLIYGVNLFQIETFI